MSETAPLYQQLYNYILDEIKSGNLKSGDRVPSEKELAEKFNVSRITSKKALEKLMQLNFINRERGRGSFVAKELPDFAEDAEDFEGENNKLLPETAWSEIGLIIADFSESYGLKLVKSIIKHCAELNCHLILKQSNGRLEEEERAIRSLIQFGVDGLVIMPIHGEYYNGELLRLVLDGFPLVLIDRYLKGIPASSVYTDNRKAAHELTDYLFDLGHEHIAFLSPPAENTSSIEERLQGFMDAYAERGYNLSTNYIFARLLSTLPGSFRAASIQVDEESISEFLKRNPQVTAFLASEYNVALVAEQTVLGLGKKIPEDFMIVCFDSPEKPFGKPAFTHIQQDEEAMGQAAVELLVKKINGEDIPLHNIVGHHLVKS